MHAPLATPPAATEPLLRERYGAEAAPATGPLNEVVSALLAHRSVRAYLPTKPPAGTVETLVAAAQSAATSSNLQTWSVIAVEDPERKSRLAALANDQEFIRQAPLLLCWLADLSRLDRLGQAHGKALGGLDYLETFIVAVVDAALAAQNAAVALESLGLGCCYIGAMRNHPEEVAAELGLPPQVMAVFGMTVGYPDPAVRTEIKPRLPQSLVLHRERYAPPEEAPVVAAYDATLAAFSRRNGLGDTAWTPRVLSRVAGAGSLSGRDRMRAALNALGFELR